MATNMELTTVAVAPTPTPAPAAEAVAEAEQEDFLVHFERTLCLSLAAGAATVEGVKRALQTRAGVPAPLVDLYVNGRKLDASAADAVPSFPAIIRARLSGGLRGGKGGFGAMLRSMGKGAGAQAVTDFGACRDLHGRRLRHVNQEVAMHKWRADGEARAQREKEGVTDQEQLDEDTPSGIPGWYLATPSWAEGIKKSYMKRRRNTALCKNWLKARQDGRRAPVGAPRWWGCPRGRDCDFAHGEEELRGEGLSELKRAKRQEAQRAKQQELQNYVDYEQEMPDDVMDAIKQGLRRRKAKTKATVTAIDSSLEDTTQEMPPDARYVSVRSNTPRVPAVEQWLQPEGGESVGLTFQHGLCELRGRGNFGTAAARACCHVTQGKWYYEVRLVTPGVVQLGWADAAFTANSESGDGVGDHERSWAYDGARQVKWSAGKDEPYATEDVWTRGDVIGCLLDLDVGTISFSRNGVELGVAFEDVTSQDCRGFFPAISVEKTEILLVNVGAQPMLYPVADSQPVIDAIEAPESDTVAGDCTVTHASPESAAVPEPAAVAAPVVVTEDDKDGKKKKKEKKKEEEKKKQEKHTETAVLEPPIDLDKFESAETLEALGLERLKQELSRRGLKCGGSLAERAVRLLSVRGKAWEAIDAKLKAKEPSAATTQ